MSDDDYEQDPWDAALAACGYVGGRGVHAGFCTLAGTEECDECPLRDVLGGPVLDDDDDDGEPPEVQHG